MINICFGEVRVSVDQHNFFAPRSWRARSNQRKLTGWFAIAIIKATSVLSGDHMVEVMTPSNEGDKPATVEECRYGPVFPNIPNLMLSLIYCK